MGGRRRGRPEHRRRRARSHHQGRRARRARRLGAGQPRRKEAQRHGLALSRRRRGRARRRRAADADLAAARQRRSARDALPDRREAQQLVRGLEADGLADRAQREAIRASSRPRASWPAWRRRRRCASTGARPPCRSPCPARRSRSSYWSGERGPPSGERVRRQVETGRRRRARNPVTLRWRIAVLVSAAIAISYLDRQTLPVAIKAIERDIPVSNQQFSLLQTAFLITYAFMYAAGGRLLDALGTRRGFTVIMVFWSLACAGHAPGHELRHAGRLPAAPGRGRRGRLPRRDARGRGVVPGEGALHRDGHHERGHRPGHDGGAAADRADVVLRELALHLRRHGRGRPSLDGVVAAGLLPPEQHPKLGDEERAHLQSVVQPARPARRSWAGSQLLRFRQTWGLVTAKFLSDAAWYFYLFWLPEVPLRRARLRHQDRRDLRLDPSRSRRPRVPRWADGSRATCCSGRCP